MIGFVLLGLIPLCALNLWLHELGHAIAARLFGYHLYEVRLGSGHLLKRFTFLDCEWWIYAFPFGGWCVAMPSSLKAYKFKRFLYVLAGPLMDVALIVAVWFLAIPALLFLGFSEEASSNGLVIYLLTLSWLTVASWKPQKTYLYGREVQTDSAHMLNLFRMEIPQQGSETFTLRSKVGIWCWILWQRGKRGECARYYLKAEKRRTLPTDPDFLMEMAFLAHAAGLWKRTRKLCFSVMEQNDSGSERYLLAADILVCVTLDFNRKELLIEGRELIERMIARHPEKITLEGTLGGILAELGQYSEAENLLRKVLEKSTALHDQAIAASCLAWLYAERGEFKAAEDYLVQAAKIEAPHRLVERKVAETRELIRNQGRVDSSLS